MSDSKHWFFVLYKAGDKPAMIRAESTLRRLCNHYLKDNYDLLVVDVLENNSDLPPDVLAIPTVIRIAPQPERRVVGDLSQAAKAAEWLGLTEAELSDEP